MQALYKTLLAAATAAILVTGTYTVQAQSEDNTSSMHHHHDKDDFGIYIGGGISTFDFTDINTILASQGMPIIKETRPAFSIGFIGRIDQHFSLEFGIAGQYSKTNTGLIKTKAGVSQLDLNLNYNFLKHSRSDLYAGLGMGMMYTTLTIDRAQAFASFAQALGSLSSERSLSSNYSLYGNIRAGYDYALTKKKDILIGVKAMYRVGFTNPEWKVGPSQASYPAAPAQSASGFTGLVCLTIY